MRKTNILRFVCLVLLGASLMFSCKKENVSSDPEPEPTPDEELSNLDEPWESLDEFVDLGLSVKWAACNIRATSPDGYGDYYTWGETSTKSSYTVKNSRWYRISYLILRSQGVIDANDNLTANFDVAQRLGKGRMPTWTEIKELQLKCTWTWRKLQNGVNGYKVTGPNGNSIFLPAAGYYGYGSGCSSIGLSGGFWSSTAHDDSLSAFSLGFDSDIRSWYHDLRYFGLTIRPVTDE